MGMGFGGVIRSWMGSEVGHDGARAEVNSSMRWFCRDDDYESGRGNVYAEALYGVSLV